MCTSIQPGKALTQKFYIQRTIFQINTIQVSDFQFTTRRRFQVLCKLDHTVIVEIQTGYAIVALRMLRFFLDRNGLTVLVKLNNSETLRIVHIIAKHGCTLAALSVFYCGSQSFSLIRGLQRCCRPEPLPQNRCQ